MTASYFASCSAVASGAMTVDMLSIIGEQRAGSCCMAQHAGRSYWDDRCNGAKAMRWRQGDAVAPRQCGGAKAMRENET
jgi:hypothetical protein